ncbi:transcriptional regulator [Halalkalibacterium halodurans]|uniref:helix-turn-helix domain-containing protein n=1 Tax=Halalkalibacterium halodurans TaxID=86665 RepID=UPI00106821A6|nr:helix-turn-helix domain-containing protein [Halalkalibacterium halodurans]TES56166.1 transcriptional regulator [Halalkalibacterium halodurans]
MSYPFTTYSGLLTAEHYRRMGNAIWLFLWCVSSTTKEVERDGEKWGIVLGNKPLKITELAEIFGVNEKTVRRWVKDLAEHDYIRVTRAPYGLIFSVKNSKRGLSSDKKARSDISVQSAKERTKMSEPERTETSNHPDKNVRSNKDITEISNITTTKSNIRPPAEGEESGGVSFPGPLRDDRQGENFGAEIPQTSEGDAVDMLANRYLELRASGFNLKPDDYASIQRTLTTVPIKAAIKLLEACFRDYEKSKRPGSKINSFSYCEPYIIDRYNELIAREQAKKGAKGGAYAPDRRGTAKVAGKSKTIPIGSGRVGRIGKRA